MWAYKSNSSWCNSLLCTNVLLLRVLEMEVLTGARKPCLGMGLLFSVGCRPQGICVGVNPVVKTSAGQLPHSASLL
jgi:hypothetical protein